MNTSDISALSANELLTLKTAVEEALEAIRQRHIEEGAALGLNLVNGDGKKGRKSRSTKEQE